MNIRNIAAGFMMAGLLALWGCTSIEEKQTPSEEKPAAEQPSASSTGAQLGAGQQGAAMAEGAMSPSALNDPNSPLSKRIFYFAYDSSDLSDIDRDIIATHGRFLAKNPTINVEVDGHTDERGSREYNLALGERRARAVEQILTLQGAQKSQVHVVSFGEERPVDMGHDEEAWRQNRRVELIYQGH